MLHGVDCKNGLVVRKGGQQLVAGNVLRQHHAAHAGQGQGGAGIHAVQGAMRHRGEDGRCVQRALHLRQVVDVVGGTGHLGARAFMDVRLAHGAGTGGCAGLLRGLGLGGVGVGGGSHRVVHGVAAHREARGERFALVHTAASSRKFSTLTASSPWLSSQKRCSRLASTVRR
ncbi:hypothetical protein D3C71_893790 [compost metagenome]